MRKLSTVILALCATVFLPMSTACNQSAIAALTQTLGNASANIAILEGNTALATQLQADTAAAVKAIGEWKQGTRAQNAVQALNIVVEDLNLVCPSNSTTGWQASCAQYAPLIVLAIGTAQSIITILNPSASVKGAKGNVEKVNLPFYPHNAKEFTTQWNGIAKANPQLRAAIIK